MILPFCRRCLLGGNTVRCVPPSRYTILNSCNMGILFSPIALIGCEVHLDLPTVFESRIVLFFISNVPPI